MRWQLKASSVAKTLAVSLSAFTMCISPVAQGAAAQTEKEKITQYLKGTGLSNSKKQMTVGEYWQMVRHVYPPKIKGEIDSWVRLNRLQLMPKVEATTIKGPNGEQVRLVFTKDGQNVSVTFTGDPDRPVKVNGVTLTLKEINNYNALPELGDKLEKADPTLAKIKTKNPGPVSQNSVLTWDEYKKLRLKQRAEYMIHMRLALEAAEKVIRTRTETKTAAIETESKIDFVMRTLFGDVAFAGKLTGQNCIVAGYISVYGQDDSCGSDRKGGALNANLRGQMSQRGASCSGNQVGCNPLVYGFKGGRSICVPAGELKYATRYCGAQAPIDTPENKKAIIESYMNAHGGNVKLQLNAEGKIPESQRAQIEPFLSELQGMLRDAYSRCSTAPLADVAASREEQGSACEELQKRMIALETFANECGPNERQEEDGTCLIPEKPNKPVKEQNKKSWLIPLLIGGVVLGLFWFLTKDKSKPKTPEYVPPAPVPEPENPVVPPVTPPVVVPPAPCNPPNVLVGGVCTSVVVPPTNPPTEGGTTLDGGGRAGGVR